MQSAIAILLMVSASARPEASMQQSLKKDFDAVVSSGRPTFSVSMLSPWRLFRSILRPAEFEEHLRTQGPDYELKIVDSDRVRKVVESMMAVKFQDSSLKATDFDARYRIRVTGGNRREMTVYVDAHGVLLYDNRVAKPIEPAVWLPGLWNLLEQDIILSQEGSWVKP